MYFLLPFKRLFVESPIACVSTFVHCSILTCIALGGRRVWGSSWISARYLWPLLVSDKVDFSHLLL